MHVRRGCGRVIVMTTDVLRYAAFTDDPAGGNPAGVVLDATGLDAAAMQQIAADVGYSETAFVVPGEGDDLDVRYFSPKMEVPFCGHATIATGVAWAEHHDVSGTLRFRTAAGLVLVEVDAGVATLTSVAPSSEAVADADLAEALGALGWSTGDLDPAIPPRVAFAGARHLVLAVRSGERLAALDYDYERLRALMVGREWVTLQLVHREAPDRFRSRNPFPPGGVVEDPATGAAAAALGGYLREIGAVETPARVVLAQGVEMGRPSRLVVDIPSEPGTGIRVSGTAVAM